MKRVTITAILLCTGSTTSHAHTVALYNVKDPAPFLSALVTASPCLYYYTSDEGQADPKVLFIRYSKHVPQYPNAYARDQLSIRATPACDPKEGPSPAPTIVIDLRGYAWDVLGDILVPRKIPQYLGALPTDELKSSMLLDYVTGKIQNDIGACKPTPCGGYQTWWANNLVGDVTARLASLMQVGYEPNIREMAIEAIVDAFLDTDKPRPIDVPRLNKKATVKACAPLSLTYDVTRSDSERWILRCERALLPISEIFLQKPFSVYHEDIPAPCNDSVLQLSSDDGVEIGLGTAVIYKGDPSAIRPIKSKKCAQQFDGPNAKRGWSISEPLQIESPVGVGVAAMDDAPDSDLVCISRTKLPSVVEASLERSYRGGDLFSARVTVAGKLKRVPLELNERRVLEGVSCSIKDLSAECISRSQADFSPSEWRTQFVVKFPFKFCAEMPGLPLLVPPLRLPMLPSKDTNP